MFYNDFILVFIEKYQQKYQQNILLPPKTTSLQQVHRKITPSLPKGFYDFIGITTVRLR